MYSSYSSLQQSQLAAQGYYDTQSIYLLVYAPGRNTALRATLADQLHRKFRLADTLGSALTEGVEGVLLVSEDVECMSTALMCFAKALQDGADYAVCNAVFGFGGATALYQSRAHLAQNRCALVSRPLLERCRAAAKDPENVTELLALAAQFCAHPARIPQALLHYERDICAEDAFSATGKRAFLMSHVLDMTGAPIVLVSAVPVLRSMGYEVVVLGPSDGGALQLFVDAGAAVITRPGIRATPNLWGWPSAPTSSSSTPWSWPGRCGPSAAPPCRCCGGSTMPLRATPTSPTRSPRSWPRMSGCTRWATTPPTPCTPSGPISRSASSSTACPTMRRRISPLRPRLPRR